MFGRILRLAATSALGLAAAVTVAGPAAPVGAGTFTTITTPSHDITYHLDSAPSAVNHLTVAGTTSQDVSSVDIFCILYAPSGLQPQPVASGVPVSNRSFHTVVSLDVLITCRLRAVPTGVDLMTTPYLGSYTGPLIRVYSFIPNRDAGKRVGFQVISEVGSGAAVASDAAQCGANGLLSFRLPDVELLGPGTDQFCSFALSAFDIVAGSSDSNAPTIRVDTKNAYLPSSVSSYLRASTGAGGLQLTLPQPADAVTFTRHSNGDITVTEKAPLERCAGPLNNTYPPTSTSCTTLVSTGVSFKRVFNMIRGDHQVELRDSFISTDGRKHNVSAQYEFTSPGIDTGTPGYIYPHHVSHFVKATHDKVITGFGSGAATVFVRSDIYALSTDQQADTVAWTWSRPPSRIQYSHDGPRFFAMPYSFTVPANKSASIGFAESESPSTAGAKKLAAKAQAEV